MGDNSNLVHETVELWEQVFPSLESLSVYARLALPFTSEAYRASKDEIDSVALGAYYAKIHLDQLAELTDSGWLKVRSARDTLHKWSLELEGGNQ